MFSGQSIRNVWGGVPDSQEATQAPVYSITSPVAATTSGYATAPKEDSPALRDRGIFIISEGFNQILAKNVLTWILESNLDPNRKYQHLTLIINSPGGEVPSAFAIIDAIRGSALPVHTIGLGQISSCGLLTFLAGAKGHRILTPNTAILSHQWAWGAFGKEHELLATYKEFGLTSERIINHYKTCTGQTEEVIREKLLPAQDVWLSAQEALDLNVCDEIRVVGV